MTERECLVNLELVRDDPFVAFLRCPLRSKPRVKLVHRASTCEGKNEGGPRFALRDAQKEEEDGEK